MRFRLRTLMIVLVLGLPMLGWVISRTMAIQAAFSRMQHSGGVKQTGLGQPRLRQ
jgi:hypothetical protein